MKPFLLIIDGPMGSGKTTTAEMMHKKFPRTAILGLDRIKWSVSGFKRDTRNNTIIYDVVFAMTSAFLAHGVNVIVEQGFRKGMVEQYQKRGKQLGARTVTVQLIAPRKALIERVDARRKKPKFPGRTQISHARVLRNFRKHAAKPLIKGHILDTTTLSPKKVVKKIMQMISKP
jgi:thymidylate kinase